MLFPMLRRPSLMRNGHRSIFADFERIQRDLDKLMATSFGISPAGFPAIQFFQNDNGYLVRADVPGLAPEALEITILGRQLTIKGERAGVSEDHEVDYHLRERRSGAFSRTLTLPKHVDANLVQATFADGVVEINLPLAATEQPRRIEIGLG